MTPVSDEITAAEELVRVLLAHAVTHVFCVPGESYLAVLDALASVRDRIEVVTCRHEAGAANMAVAHGKLTGRPGVCMVTRGPGATHAAIGVHTAKQDSTPMILFVGQVARDQKEREAFQEVDYRAAFGPLSKWAGGDRRSGADGRTGRTRVFDGGAGSRRAGGHRLAGRRPDPAGGGGGDIAERPGGGRALSRLSVGGQATPGNRRAADHDPRRNRVDG